MTVSIEHPACYVYGVARIGDDPLPAALPEEGVIPDSPVDLLRSGDLAAIASPVPPEQFNQDALEAVLEDDAWMHARILAHHSVLDALAHELTLVAFKFLTVYTHRDGVLEMLSRNRADLQYALSHIEGATELGVKVYCHVDRLKTLIATRAQEPVALRAELLAASPGASFFLRKRLQRAMNEHLRSELAVQTDRVYRRLGENAKDAALHQPRQPDKQRGDKKMLLNASYLLDRTSEAAFRATFDDLQKQLGSDGFVLELTGPWPPYSFSSLSGCGSPMAGGQAYG